MPGRGRGRPSTQTGQASSILGDLQALSSDDLENLKDVKVSFTCKKCGSKSPTLKRLIEHLSECKVGLKAAANTPSDASDSTTGTPRRRGRPRKNESTVTSTPGKPDVPIILPEAEGRVTRISSGSLKRKSAVDMLTLKTADDDEDSEEDFDDNEGDDDYMTVPKSGRGRGRPRKYPRPDYDMIENLMGPVSEREEGEITGELVEAPQHEEGEAGGPEGEATESGKEQPSKRISMGCPNQRAPVWRRPRSQRSYKCDTCKNRFFTTLDELTIHCEAHVGELEDLEKYKCKVCSYEATLWSRMLFHLVTHDEFKEKLKNTESVRNVFGRFGCPYQGCNKIFDKKLNMTSHWRKVHHKLDRMCEVCKVTLVSVDEKTFIRHVEKCKNIVQKCDQCDYQTAVSSNMRKHMKIHTGDGYQCSICNALFPTKQRMTIHEQIHNKDRPRYECEICGNTFCSEDAVKKHISRMHIENRRDWKCSKCNYVAKLEVDLRKHENIVHNKKFKCDQCEYMTNTEKNFIQHKEYHEPDRIYPCPFQESNCFFRASTTKQLATHVSQMHNMRTKHQCPICLKYFKKKTHLLRHLVTHTTEKPYQCRDCGESFYSHSTYYRHRHKTGHDAKREGIVSVPQNITIQYLEEVPSEEKNQVQAAMETMPVQELEKLLSTEGVDPSSLPPQVMVQTEGEESVAAQTIVMDTVDPSHILNETVASIETVPLGEAIVEEVAESLHVQGNVIDGQHQQLMASQSQESVTYVLKMEGEDGQTHEVTLDPGVDLAESIANLQTEGHQIVYEEAAPEVPAPVPEGQVQTVVEVEPTSSGTGAPQYAIVVWPEGDEPEAALSMLQLQQSNQSK